MSNAGRILGGRERGEPAPLILMYHRVAKPCLDPWGLAVAPELFEEHVRALCRYRTPMSMREFIQQLQAGNLVKDAVAVTFDDGYVDNLRSAKPILAREDVPATVFLATGSIGQRREFWWDELARLILCRAGTAGFQLCIDGRNWHLPMEPTEPTAADAQWRAWHLPEKENQAHYLEIWNCLWRLQEDRRQGIMQNLREAVRANAPDPGDLPMGPEDVAELVAGGLIEGGAHTVMHNPLTALPAEERDREIQESKSACEALTGRSVQGFAYPHGDRDPETIATVRRCGFAWACSSRSAAIQSCRADLYDLPRLVARNWGDRDFIRALQLFGER